MTVNFIAALESLGYNRREAAFLYLVAAHSGYFLRRQFNYFIDRHKGFLAHRFLEKARAAGHVETIDYGQGFHLYHLSAKPIYRWLGNPDSQNRRRKGDGMIRARLMMLDYVLENDSDYYFIGEEERRDFFTQMRGIPEECLPGSFHFWDTLPISVREKAHAATSRVRFVFMDEGLLSTSKFSRFITEMAPLFSRLGAIELIYAACSDYNFENAEHEFRRYLGSPASLRQRALLPGFEQPQLLRPLPPSASFTTLLFHYSYPPIQRGEPRGSVRRSEPGSADRNLTAGVR